MKKIGIEPDSRTYGILLDGLSMNDDYKPALAQALTLYHKLASPSSSVKQNIFHTNSMLKCCLRWRDVDAMWTVAENIPASGRQMADARTYTTMLNTIRIVGEGGKERALADAMSLWEGVVTRWQAGTLHIDEQLACTMAQALLTSSRPENWDSVFSLIQQVFGVPRLVPKLGSKASTMRRGWQEDVETEEGDMPSFYAEVPSEEVVGTVPPDPSIYKTHLFDVLKPSIESHALVGNQLVSVVLSACLALRAYREGEEYWKLLSPAVTPDIDNHLHYLRVLAGARNSRAAVEHIKHMQIDRPVMPPNAYFIAISACQRNRDRPLAYKDALTILNLMHTHKSGQDPRVLLHFVKIAISTDDTAIMKAAYNRIGPHYINLRELLSTEGKTLPQMERVFEFCNTTCSLCDKLLHRMSGIDSNEELTSMRQHRTKLNIFITATFNKDGSETGDPKTIKRMKDARKRVVEGKAFREVQRSGKKWDRGVLGPNWKESKRGNNTILAPTSINETPDQITSRSSRIPFFSEEGMRDDGNALQKPDGNPRPYFEGLTEKIRDQIRFNVNPFKARETDNIHLVPSTVDGSGLRVDRSYNPSTANRPTYQPAVHFSPTHAGLQIQPPKGHGVNPDRTVISGFVKKTEPRPVLTPNGILRQSQPWGSIPKIAKKSWISNI